MVGSSGLEPPTSRLSGVCSNQLSYEPVDGGGKRIRTDDPLLAGQVLYQLSYTPIRAFIKSGFYVDASGLLSAHPRKLQNKCSANVMLKEHWYIKNEEKETIQNSVSTENG